MKRFSLAGMALLVLLAVPLVSFGATFRAGEQSALRKGELVPGNFYPAGGAVTVEGDVAGDLVAAGGNIFVNGKVRDDALVAGGTVNLLGPVGGDVRAAGGNVTIGGEVGGEAVVGGGTVALLSSAKVAKGVALGGGQVSVDGEITGDLRVAGGVVTLNGIVHGNVNVKADQKLMLGPTAVIEGNLIYTAPKQAEIAEGATVKGDTKYSASPARGAPKGAKDGFAAVFGAWIVLKLLMMIAAGLLVLRFMRPWLGSMLERTHAGFGREAFRGFAALVVVPAAAIVLFVTVIGALPGFLALLLYAALLVLSKATVGVLFGSVLERMMKKSAGPVPANWKTVVGGTIALAVVGFIPFLGWIVAAVFFLATFGAWGAFFHETLKRIA